MSRSALALFLALATLSAPAAAEVDLTQIQGRIDAAKKLFDSELPSDALDALESVAAELGPEGEARFPALRFMMARCLMELDRPEEAMAALARFEALARDDQERALAVEWRGKLLARAFGQVVVTCAEGETARIEAGEAPPEAACPATFEQVVIGRHRVVVTSPGPEREAIAEVVAGQSVTVDPKVPPPTAPWIHGGVSLVAGSALFSGGLPDFVDAGVGSRVEAELFGDLRVLGPVWLRVGFGYGLQRFAFTDTALGVDGVWSRHGLVAPGALRIELPYDLAVTAGGGFDFIFGAEEARDDETFDEADRFTELVPFARAEVDYTVYRGFVDLRLALRYRYDFAPLFEDADATTQAVDLALHVVL